MAGLRKKGLQRFIRNPLFLFGEPCRDRTDKIMITFHPRLSINSFMYFGIILPVYFLLFI
jgi:hypothetical protein